MARPEPTVLLEQQLMNDTTWQVLAAEAYYVITYKGQPINLRVILYTINGPAFKYKKLTYANLGNARAQARMLNHRFKCLDFDVVEVTT